ncbi:unnamed protein product [Linum trigynum]|uniref:Uncharacterized protein n=1 Tax=Linum trigynum TaxID=586398 RepID=A0AAV2D983_9ROSI
MTLIADDSHRSRHPLRSPESPTRRSSSTILTSFTALGVHRRWHSPVSLPTTLTTLGAHDACAFIHSSLLSYMAPLLGHDLPHGVSALMWHENT